MITVGCSVTWSDPKRDGDGVPRRYVILVAAPYHKSQQEHVVLRKPEQKGPLSLAVPGTQPSNLPITIQLWTWREADVGGECMYRAAHAVVTLESLTGAKRVSLINVDGAVQAHLLLTHASTSTLKLGPPDAQWEPIRFPPKMSKAEMAAGLQANGKVPIRFLRDQVGHMYGKVPVWMLCQMYTGDLATRITERYLRNALHHSVRLLGFSDEAAWIAARGKPLYYEVLAKVCMFHTQWGLYLFDQTWQRGKGFVGNDQFSVIEAAPDLKTGSGDCEDDALSITLTAMRLHQMRFKSFKRGDPLRELIRLSHGYCCVTADVSINPDGLKLSDDVLKDDPDELSLHHLAMLVPWSRVAELVSAGPNTKTFGNVLWKSKSQQIERTSDWPILSMEGTEACRANCDGDSKGLDAFAQHVRSVRREHKLPVMRRCHMDASMKAFEEAQFYRQMIALYSPDLYQLFSIAMLLVCDGGKIGARWKTWIEETGALSLVVSKVATDQEQRTLVRLCQTTPKLALLDTPDSSRIAYPKAAFGPGVQYLVFREIDITQKESTAMVNAIHSEGKYKLVSTQRIVTAGNAVSIAYLFAPST